MYFSFKVEKVKKENDIFTYKEIVAFQEGRRLDEMEKQQEIGKRPYQSAMIVLGSAVFGFVICYLVARLFRI